MDIRIMVLLVVIVLGALKLIAVSEIDHAIIALINNSNAFTAHIHSLNWGAKMQNYQIMLGIPLSTFGVSFLLLSLVKPMKYDIVKICAYFPSGLGGIILIAYRFR
jgi:hypothetical protein